MERPLYRVVIDTIVERIASGALPPGAMLPSETQLGAELGVSQGTARKALGELERRGLVQRAQGRGTFVTVRTPESSLFNFFRLRNVDGSQETPNLEHETVRRRKATARERDVLYGAPHDVIEIDRLRSLNDGELVHEISVISASMFAGLDERAPLPNTLYVFYQQAYSIIIVRADEQLRAQPACSADAERLNVPEGTALLCVERLAIDVLDRIVERRVSRFPTRSHAYIISLT
ncbi:MAG: GntR family transcriptional regulator [Roseibium sp.]|nr:GntR family transcriptional regulator [Roseibium sp.]